MCEHKLKFIRQSMVFVEGEKVLIDIYQCLHCKGYCIINTTTDAKISLGGKLGEEI